MHLKRFSQFLQMLVDCVCVDYDVIQVAQDVWTPQLLDEEFHKLTKSGTRMFSPKRHSTESDQSKWGGKS